MKRIPPLRVVLVRSVFPVLRALTVFVVIGGIAIFSWLRSAEAHIGEALHGFGAVLLDWHDTTLDSAPRQLSLNGLSFRLLTASTPLSVGETLERIRASCQHSSERPSPEELLLRRTATTEPGPLDGTYLDASDSEGVVACVDTGHRLGVPELIDRLTALSSTGDLASLGELRYAVARRSGDTTTVLILWTEGAFPLLHAFPKKGDVPGMDPEGIPRPVSSRRVLSAAEQGAPYKVTAYAVGSMAPDALREWYERSLKERGFATTRSRDHATLVARQGDRTVVVRTRGASQGEAVVTIVELS